MRLAVISTHPIQYYAPLFRRMASGRHELKVFFGWEGMSGTRRVDRGFGQAIQWDVPLLDGYDHEFLNNVSADPGSHQYRGIDCPGAVSRIEAWAPDAVLVFGWKYRTHLRIMRHFHGRIPVLFRGDSTMLDESPGMRSIARRMLLTWVYRHVDLALTVGTGNAEYFRVHGIPEERHRWIPHAVDVARFAADHDSREVEARAWRAELGIPADERAILFIGKLESKKAPEELLSAFERLDDSSHLIFGGTGPLEGELRARSLGNERVHFIGFQNQSRMPIAYRLADIFVLPSRGPGETWGLAINEAFACGRPAIVSDRVGCAIDLVKEDETGWIFRANDEGDLKRALERSRGREARAGAEARRLIDMWSIESATAGLEEVLDELQNMK